MPRRKAVTFAALAVLCAAAPAAVHAGPSLDTLFARADTNQDGVVSRAEFRASRAARFRELDRNGDGFLTVDDFPGAASWLGAGREARLMAYLRRFDTDHDGRISEAEFIAGSMRMFDQADTNHDGVIDRAEAAAEVRRIRATLAR